MTAKEKADELIDKVSSYSDYETMDDILPKKKLALIVVDEILSLNAESFDKLPNPHHYYSKKYWQEVKQEINKV